MTSKTLQPLPLGRRIFIELGLIILLLLVAMQLVSFFCMRASLRNSFKRNAEVSAALQTVEGIEALDGKGQGKLDELLRRVRESEHDLLYLVAFDSAGKIVAAEGDSSYIVDFHQFVSPGGEDHRSHGQRFDRQVLHVIHPLHRGKSGCIHMGISWEPPVDLMLGQVFLNMALVTTVGLTVLGIVAWLFFCRMTRPVVELIETVRMFGGGRLSVRAKERPVEQDEAALLASVFNQMADQMEGQVRDLIRTQHDLADEKARVQSIVDSMTQSVTLSSREGRISYCNRSAKRFCRREHPCEQKTYATHRADWPEALQAFTEVASGAAGFRRVQRQLNGRDFELTLIPALDADGAPQGIVEIVTDSTESLSSWRSLAHAEKLNVVGQLAAGVAHEINSPLDGAIEASHIIERNLQSPEKAKHFCQAQRSGLERIAQIVRRLLTFSRAPSHTSSSVVTIAKLLEEAQAILRHRLTKRVMELPPASATAIRVRGDELGLVQVLVNLLNNAIDVTPRGGPLKIAVEAREPGFVAISIVDQGPGVSEKAAQKLFTPFFTTKELGKGTGLGLAVSRNIVRDHGGDIEFENLRPPYGARFTVTLPVEEHVPTGGAEHAETQDDRERAMAK